MRVARCAFSPAGVDWGVAAWALAGTVIPVVIVLRWLLPNVPQDFKVPVYAYTLVISAMVVAAVGAFAVDEALVDVEDTVTTVRIHNKNTGSILRAHVPIVDTTAAVD